MVTQNDAVDTSFPWSEQAESAAVFCAEGFLSDAQIARKVKVSRSTITRWRRHPEFRSRLMEHVAEFRERALAHGIARIDHRLDHANRRHEAMSRLIVARGKAMKGEAPGAETGLLERRLRYVTVKVEKGNGDTFTESQPLYEYTFDAALVRELASIEKQVAQDTGQWSNKVAISGPNDGPIQIEARIDLDAQIDALAAEYGITRDAVLDLMDEDSASEDSD